MFSRIRYLLKKADRRHDHTRGAITALKAVVFLEGLLHGMHDTVFCETFDRGDAFPIDLSRKNCARLDRFPVEVDGARATRRRVAAYVCPGESARLSQVVNE